jgi:hypothetical protein
MLMLICASSVIALDAAVGQRPGRAPRLLPVEVRAQQYWNKRAQRDLTGAYAFYCPSYKARVPLSEYVKQTRLVRFQLQDVHIAKTTPDGARMQVTVAYRFVVPTLGPEPVSGETTEVWERSGRAWCKVDEPLLLPIPSTSKAEK